MERVAFLIEPTHERIGCMLNPESVTVRRTAGVEPRRLRGGALAGRGLSDDPLHFTGGGCTEIELCLLFDVGLAGSSAATADVRDLTGPLWRLAENAEPVGLSYGRPPTVQFVWGKAWRIPAVITAVAERLEHFDPDGVPGRSWLRLRLVRVPEPPLPMPAGPGLGDAMPLRPDVPEVLQPPAALQDDLAPGVVIAPGRSGGGGERLDEIAARTLGDAALWRWLAYFNDLADPLRVAVGTLLRLPPRAARVGSP